MNRSSVRNLTGLAILAVATLATAAACTTPSVQALPIQAPSPSSSSVAAPGPTATPQVASPAASPRSKPTTRPPTCLGAVVYTFDTRTDATRWPTLCISIGGVLRLTNHGPDGMRRTPDNLMDCDYEAAVRDCRLIRTGTVRITMDKPTGTHTLTLIVTASSPGPAPACVPQGETYVFEVRDHTMAETAACLKLGAVLRLENHGPDNFSIEPSGAASCWYEAGMRECQFTKAATVTFTFTFPHGYVLTFTVVAIK